MALTLTQLQTMRDALVTAIASGRLEIRFENRSVKYQSTADMKTALGLLDGEIATAANTNPTRQIRMYTESGW